MDEQFEGNNRDNLQADQSKGQFYPYILGAI